jgi:hypothetical protein
MQDLHLLPYALFACAGALFFIGMRMGGRTADSNEHRTSDFIAHALNALIFIKSQRKTRTDFAGVEETLFSALKTASTDERLAILKLLAFCYDMDPALRSDQSKQACDELHQLLSGTAIPKVAESLCPAGRPTDVKKGLTLF